MVEPVGSPPNAENDIDRPLFEERDTNLLDLLLVWGKYKRLVVSIPLVACVASLVTVLVLPNTYTATVTLLPPQEAPSSLGALLSQVSTSTGLLPSVLGAPTPSGIYTSMLRSRTIEDVIIKKFNLMKLYDRKYPTDARKDLERATSIAATQDGMILISVDDTSRDRAVAIANTYVQELKNLTSTLAISRAAQKRLFYQEQLTQVRVSLAKAEEELANFQEKTHLVAPEGQTQATVLASSSLAAQVAAKEIEIAANRTFATDKNPEVVRALEELRGLKAQQAKLENANAQTSGDVLVSLGKAPKKFMALAQKLRDVQFNQTLFKLLSEQYEAAKLDEARDPTLIQVVDSPVPADKPSPPSKSLIVVVVTLISGIIGLIFVLFVARITEVFADPRNRDKVKDLKRHYWKIG